MSAFASYLLLFSSVTMGQNVGLPLGVPPAADDAALRRALPAKCVGYLGWSGTSTPSSSSNHPTERLLANAEIQRVIKTIGHMTKTPIQILGKELGGDGAEVVNFAYKWVTTGLHRPGAIFIEEVFGGGGVPEVHGGMLINMGKLAPTMKKELDSLVKNNGAIRNLVTKVQVGKHSLYRLNSPGPTPPDLTFGLAGDYFVLGIQPGNAKKALAKLGNASAKPPEWLAKLQKQLAVPKHSATFYLDLKQIIDAMSGGVPQIDTIGFGNLGPLAFVTGFDDKGVVTRGLMGIQGKAKGILSFLDGPALTRKDLRQFPANATLAMVAKFNLGGYIKNLIATADKVVPGGGDQIRRSIDPFSAVLGFDVQRDALANLGDVWGLYHSKSAGGWFGAIGVVPIKNLKAIKSVEKKLLERLRSADDRTKQFSLGTNKYSGRDIHHMTIRFVPVAPSWSLLDDRVIVGLYPQNLRDVIDGKKGARTLADVLPQSFFDRHPLAVMRYDAKELYKICYPLLQLGNVAALGASADPFLLPSGPAVRKHLGHGSLVISRSKVGLEFTGRGVVPINIIHLLPTWAATFAAYDVQERPVPEAQEE